MVLNQRLGTVRHLLVDVSVARLDGKPEPMSRLERGDIHGTDMTLSWPSTMTIQLNPRLSYEVRRFVSFTSVSP